MSDAISEIYSSQSIGDIIWLLVKGYLKPKKHTETTQVRKYSKYTRKHAMPQQWIKRKKEKKSILIIQPLISKRSYELNCCTWQVSNDSMALLRLRFDFSAIRAASPHGICIPSFFPINSNTLTICDIEIVPKTYRGNNGYILALRDVSAETKFLVV